MFQNELSSLIGDYEMVLKGLRHQTIEEII